MLSEGESVLFRDWLSDPNQSSLNTYTQELYLIDLRVIYIIHGYAYVMIILKEEVPILRGGRERHGRSQMRKRCDI